MRFLRWVKDFVIWRLNSDFEMIMSWFHLLMLVSMLINHLDLLMVISFMWSLIMSLLKHLVLSLMLNAVLMLMFLKVFLFQGLFVPNKLLVDLIFFLFVDWSRLVLERRGRSSHRRRGGGWKREALFVLGCRGRGSGRRLGYGLRRPFGVVGFSLSERGRPH